MGNVIDLTGQTFGSLFVTGRDSSPTCGEAKWLCSCLACGKEGHSVKGTLLRDGRAKSCGCQIGGSLDLTNQRFGRWLVIERTNPPLIKGGKEPSTRSAWWWCKCDCGEEKPVMAQSLRKGLSTSCGCYQKERAVDTHRGHEPYEKDPAKRAETAKLAHVETRRYGSNAPRPKTKFQETLYNKKWLETKYIDQKLSKREIADRASSSVAAVTNALNRFKIKRQEPESKDNISINKRPRLTGDALTINVMYARARRLVPKGPCVICKDVGRHINHKDRNPWNNSLDNLERVCPTCHNRQHAIEVEVMLEWLRDKFDTPFLDVHLEARHRLTHQQVPCDSKDFTTLLRSQGFPEVTPVGDGGQRALIRLSEITCYLDEKAILGPYVSTGTGPCASFFPNRYRARYSDTISAWDAWHNDDLLQKAVQLQLNNGDPITPERVLKALVFQHRTPSVFRPAVAKYIYATYGNNGVVWDPCAGYGGRLMGAMAAGVFKYIGTDIEPETVDGNRRLAEALGVSERCLLVQARAEGFGIPEPLDLVFTSPPYFNLEVYGQATEKTFIEQGSVQGWVKNFLEPVMLRAFYGLKSGGHLVLNLPTKPVLGVRLDEAAQVVAKELGFIAEAPIFMPIRRRGVDRSNYKLDPILIWSKP